LGMPLVHDLARSMLAPMFIAGGLDAFNHPEGKAGKAATVTSPVAESLGLPDDPTAFVRANGAIQILGGALLGTGAYPRIAALALAGSLIPTTIAGHPFWNATDEKERAMQRTQFLKNVAMLGGLLLIVSDRRASRKAAAA
jgi:putative oxidoreductase